MKSNKTNNQVSSMLSKSDIEVIDMVQIHGGDFSMMEAIFKDKDVTVQRYCPNYNANCVKGCGA